MSDQEREQREQDEAHDGEERAQGELSRDDLEEVTGGANQAAPSPPPPPGGTG